MSMNLVIWQFRTARVGIVSGHHGDLVPNGNGVLIGQQVKKHLITTPTPAEIF